MCGNWSSYDNLTVQYPLTSSRHHGLAGGRAAALHQAMQWSTGAQAPEGRKEAADQGVPQNYQTIEPTSKYSDQTGSHAEETEDVSPTVTLQRILR